jgi:hypothetical protein
MSAMNQEQRTAIQAQLGDAQPASDGLLESFGKAIADRSEHDHPKWEDLFCMNLSAYMGERSAPVLRRLLDAEARVAALEADATRLQSIADHEHKAFIDTHNALNLLREDANRVMAENGVQAQQAELERVREEAAKFKKQRGEWATKAREAESRGKRYRIAWRMARTRALSVGGAADRAGARLRELLPALQEATFGLIGMQMERDAAQRHAAELEERPLAWADRLDLKSLDNLLITLGQATEYEPMTGAIDQIHEVLAGFRAAAGKDTDGGTQPPAGESTQPTPHTDASTAFMQLGRTAALAGLRAELHIEGQPPIVGRYCGFGSRRVDPGAMLIEPALVFEWLPEDDADDDARVVAYRSPTTGRLYCRLCCTWLGVFADLASEVLPDGGICARCGRDVLIDPPQSEAGEAR